MTVHDRFRLLAAAAIDFDLRADERELLDAHLAGCDACRRVASGLRADAAAIAGLPEIPAPAALRLPAARLRPLASSVRLALVAALVALLALGAVLVGAELVRRSAPPQVVLVPPSTEPAPSASAQAASPAPSGGPVLPPAAIGWTVSQIETTGSPPTDISFVMSGPAGLVAIAEMSCAVNSDGEGSCTPIVHVSPDGVAWERLPGPVVDLSTTAIAGSGGGPGYVVLTGSSETEPGEHAAWFSPDGRGWERVGVEAFAGARPTDLVTTDEGWVAVGSAGAGDTLRGAAWRSVDGRAWERAPDGPVFDVGVELDDAGGILRGGLRFAGTDGTIVVASGATCEAAAGCTSTTWRSDDGLAWQRGDDGELGAFPPDVVAVRGTFVMLAGSPLTWWSTDGLAWRQATVSGLALAGAVGATEAGLIAAELTTDGARLAHSPDGYSWTEVDSDLTREGRSVGGVGAAPLPDGSVVFVVRYDGPGTVGVDGAVLRALPTF